MNAFTSVAPGRLCLFGEHQDYLGLPVIASSLPLFCRIQVVPTAKNRILELQIPQLDQTICYNLDQLPQQQDPAVTRPDFALAAVHEAINDGWNFVSGARCISNSDMIMQAGCSSSSAFCVAWIQVLARLAGQTLTPLELAQKAHRAEVAHFGAPGGTMDHVTSAIGGLLRIGPGMWDYKALPRLAETQIGVWVLAYSGEPKETFKHLHRCKTVRLALLEKLGNWDTNRDDLDSTEQALLLATRTNRDTETEAYSLWNEAEASPHDRVGPRLGELMRRHHEALRDGLGLSTPRLEALGAAAIAAGAWGFKVVGSGSGGCGVAWCPVDKAAVVEAAMQEAGAPRSWIINQPSPGACILDTL